MRVLFFIFSFLTLFYFGISWALNKPKEASQLVRSVDRAGEEVTSKTSRAIQELKK